MIQKLIYYVAALGHSRALSGMDVFLLFLILLLLATG